MAHFKLVVSRKTNFGNFKFKLRNFKFKQVIVSRFMAELFKEV